MLPFPLRNPSANIKDAKRLAEEATAPVFGFGYGKATTQPNINAKEILEKVASSLKAAFLAHRRGTGRKGGQPAKSHRLIFDISSDDEQASAVNADEKDILNLGRVDKCLISMEELEMDIKNMIHKQMREQDGVQDSHDGAHQGYQNPFYTEQPADVICTELADPVREHYVQILKNILNLCEDPSIIGVLVEGLTRRKGKPPVMSTFEKEKERKMISSLDQSAKNILVKAIEKMMQVEDQQLSPRQMEDLETKLGIVRGSIEVQLKNAASPPLELEGDKPKSYIDQAGKHIEKLLAAARKKKKERNRAAGMLENEVDPVRKSTTTSEIVVQTDALASGSASLHELFS